VAQFVSYVTENEKYYYIYSVFQVVREGLELPQETPGKTALSATGGTESGTLAAQLALSDADLQVVIDAWPSMSESTKQAILALIQASSE
jgi:hypothetical protein